MLEIDVYSLGDPGTFDITDKTDPMYYVARYNHEMSKNLYDMDQAGFKWRQDEASDISGIMSDFDTYGNSLETWFTTAVAASNDELPVPAPPTLPTLPSNPISGIIVSILTRLAIRIVVDWLRKKLDPDTESKEIAQILKKGLIGVAGGTEYSFIELLQNTPLEIRINKKSEFEDITYTGE